MLGLMALSLDHGSVIADFVKIRTRGAAWQTLRDLETW